MKRHRQITRQAQSEDVDLNGRQQRETCLEFESAEEVIRHECRRIAVPSNVAERLRRSIANEPKPPKAWWKRWFS